MYIDTRFDFRSDARDRDPDKWSPTLRRYHKHLWSKSLPDGRFFQLDCTFDHYLHHRSAIGEFTLSSDSVIQTFSNWKRCQPMITQFIKSGGDVEKFSSIGYTIGGMLVFPSNKINGRMTINGARGFNPRIADRVDLTLECIRRYYLSDEVPGYTHPLNNPLYNDLLRYREFFRLFTDFRGYVDFFLLQDLAPDYSKVLFFSPFDNFISSPRPQSLEEYRSFKEKSIEFVIKRNERIDNITNKSLN
jgi:hypothetical protein